MGFTRLLYRSIPARADFDPSDLDILRVALRHNAAAGITGYLWRANGQFFQALHGPAGEIAALMARIAADPRHRDLDLLFEEPDEAVSPFPDWSMGYDHFLALELGADLDPDGARPPLSAGESRAVFARMVEAAEEMRLYGSAFPHARSPGEDQAAWLARLDASA